MTLMHSIILQGQIQYAPGYLDPNGPKLVNQTWTEKVQKHTVGLYVIYIQFETNRQLLKQILNFEFNSGKPPPLSKVITLLGQEASQAS